jgi:dolichol-phosphate mannosyltransferase
MTTSPGPPWPLTVVVPTRNEAGNIAPLLERMPSVDKVLFVDDSDDDTDADDRAACRSPTGPRRAAAPAARPAPRWPVRRGRRRARAVDTEWMCVMDGDLQHPPEVIDKIMALAETSDVDLVVASRKNWDSINEGLGPVRSFVSWVFGRVALVLLRPRIGSCSDPLSGFFAVRTSAVDPSILNPTGFKILLEILVTHPDLRRAEVGFAFARRGSGESNGSVREAARYLRHVVRLRRRLRRDAR